jgi:hypothetical protein
MEDEDMYTVPALLVTDAVIQGIKSGAVSPDAAMTRQLCTLQQTARQHMLHTCCFCCPAEACHVLLGFIIIHQRINHTSSFTAEKQQQMHCCVTQGPCPNAHAPVPAALALQIVESEVGATLPGINEENQLAFLTQLCEAFVEVRPA